MNMIDSSETFSEEETNGWGILDELPGNPIMWVLIISELVVFGAFFIGYAGARIFNADLFTQSQNLLDRSLGGINTIILVTSGYMAALAGRAALAEKVKQTRLFLGAAILLGGGFCLVKISEYADKAAQGINIDTNTFFTLFYLMTGFHFLHVVFGMILLAIACWRTEARTVETVTAFWHMVDLIWVLLYPLVYLVR